MLPFQDTKLSPKERAHDLCARLTSQEKTGQLNQRLYGFQSVRREGERLTLDEAFLTAPDTVYPVAAATTSQATIGSAYINDADVNSGSPSTNYGSSSTLWVGYINGAKYRSYVQFCIEPYESYIAPYGITDAYLLLYEKSGNTSTFTMQPRIPNNIWTYTSLTWNNQPGYLSAFNGVSAPSNVPLTQTSTMYRVYMTAYVQACMRNYVSQALPRTIHEQRGLMLKIANETSAQVRMFNSTNASSNKPTLMIYYNPSYYGTAGTYWDTDGEDPNCAGYALGRAQYADARVFTFSGNGTVMSEEAYLADLIDHYSTHLNAAVTVDNSQGQSAAVPAGTYRMAFRARRVVMSDGYIADYHVIVQNKNGSWSGKMGTSPSAKLGLINVTANSDPAVWDTVWNVNDPNMSTYLLLVTGSYR